MLPFLSLRLRNIRATAIGMVAGAAMGLGWIGYVLTLERTSVATTGILYLTYPFFTLIIAWILLQITPGTTASIGAILVMIAGWMIFEGGSFGRPEVKALAIAIAAPVSLGYALTIQKGWLQHLNPLQRLACLSLGATLALAPVVILRHPVDVLVPDGEKLAPFLGLAVAATLAPQFIYSIAAPRIGVLRTAIVGSIEVPAMFMLGWLFYAERAGEYEVGAMALIIVAAVVMAFSRQPHGRPPMA